MLKASRPSATVIMPVPISAMICAANRRRYVRLARTDSMAMSRYSAARSGMNFASSRSGRAPVRVGEKREYSAGRTSNVSSVAVRSPPITTVASGLCTSAPVPVASAMGTKPSEATRAVMTTGRKRVSAPSWIAVFGSVPSSISLRICVSITRPLRTATPDNAMNVGHRIQHRRLHRALQDACLFDQSREIRQRHC
jgi:hypothetical protein